jgi:hypothetical protein
MRTGISTLARASLVAAFVLGSASFATAQATIASTMDPTLALVERAFVQLAEAMPAESYGQLVIYARLSGVTPPASAR